MENMNAGYKQVKCWLVLVLSVFVMSCSSDKIKEKDEPKLTENEEFEFVFNHEFVSISAERIDQMNHNIGKQAAYFHNMIVFLNKDMKEDTGIEDIKREDFPAVEAWCLSQYKEAEKLMVKVKSMKRGEKYDPRLMKMSVKYGETGIHDGSSLLRGLRTPEDMSLISDFGKLVGFRHHTKSEMIDYYLKFKEFYANVFDDGADEYE